MSEISEKTWWEANPKKALGLVYLALFILLELTLRGLAQAGVINLSFYTTSSINNAFLGDINPHFGVWHYPNRTVPHKSPCFDVTYISNSHGARDPEREFHSAAARRGVVLGDSFVEGIGVNLEQRMTNVAEKNSGIELLNFGVAGHFSSTQQWLLYRELASKFDHSDVFIYLLPANDFIENDPQAFSPKRYRPYLKAAENGDTANGEFEVYYTVKFEHREQLKNTSKAKRWRREIYNHVYIFNVIRQIGELFEGRRDLREAEQNAALHAPAGYDEQSELDVGRLLFGYRKIIELAGDRRVTIFVVPRLIEFQKFEAGKNNFRIVRTLEKFAAQYPRVRVVDLLPHFVSFAERHQVPVEKIFHACDGHWSELGNQAAAEALVAALQPAPTIKLAAR